MVPSAFSASTAAGYAGFLSMFITRGIGLPDASIALRRKRLAAAVSRLAVNRKSIVCPGESSGIQRPVQILVLYFYVDIGLVDPIAVIGRLQMRSAAFVQLGCIYLHPAPNAARIHLDATFGHQLGDVLVGERISEIPAHAQHDHFSRVLASVEGVLRVDRHRLLPYQDAGSEVRNGTPDVLLVARQCAGADPVRPNAAAGTRVG